MHWFWNLLYGSVAAEFRSAYGLDESVARLRAVARRSAFAVVSEPAAAGVVTASRVRLQRVIPMVGNSFKPFFYGRFEMRDGQVVLAGRFTMLRFVKAFMTFWFGFVVLFVLGTLPAALRGGDRMWLLPLGGAALFAAGLGLTAIGRWLARNDVAWLSGVIANALRSAPAPAEGGASRGADHDQAAPTVLRVVAFFLLITGVLAVAIALVGFSFAEVVPGGRATLQAASGSSRIATGLYGACLCVLAAGVHRRRRWAWWGGFAVIAAGALLPLAQPLPVAGMPVAMQIAFWILAAAISLYWGWWWYAQGRLFAAGAP